MCKNTAPLSQGPEGYPVQNTANCNLLMQFLCLGELVFIFCISPKKP